MPKMLDDNYNPAGPDSDQRWDQYAEKYKPKKGWNKIRLYGLIYSDARHDNITTKTGKAYNEFCLGYDVDNDGFFADRRELCDCCALDLPYKIRRFVSVIDVDAWEKRPADLSQWNPFYLFEMSSNLHDKIMALKSHPLNSTGANVGHPTGGALIGLKYDPDSKSPANVYDVSLLQSGWTIPEALLDLTFSQTSPDGQRHLHKSDGKIPAAWVYYGCRNSRDRMQRSLRTHGHLKNAATEQAHASVQQRAQNIREELASIAPRASNVAKLAQLRSEEPASPPPPALPADDMDQIPF